MKSQTGDRLSRASDARVHVHSWLRQSAHSSVLKGAGLGIRQGVGLCLG